VPAPRLGAVVRTGGGSRKLAADPARGRRAAGESAASGLSAHVAGETAWVLCAEVVPGGELAATNLFVREKGAWRMVHHHASPLPPPARRPAGFRELGARRSQLSAYA